MRLGRVYGRALYFFNGNPEAATEWLNWPQYAFGGVRPLEMTRTDVGAQEVETLISQLEHGIPA